MDNIGTSFYRSGNRIITGDPVPGVSVEILPPALPEGFQKALHGVRTKPFPKTIPTIHKTAKTRDGQNTSPNDAVKNYLDKLNLKLQRSEETQPFQIPDLSITDMSEALNLSKQGLRIKLKPENKEEKGVRLRDFNWRLELFFIRAQIQYQLNKDAKTALATNTRALEELELKDGKGPEFEGHNNQVELFNRNKALLKEQKKILEQSLAVAKTIEEADSYLTKNERTMPRLMLEDALLYSDEIKNDELRVAITTKIVNKLIEQSIKTDEHKAAFSPIEYLFDSLDKLLPNPNLISKKVNEELASLARNIRDLYAIEDIDEGIRLLGKLETYSPNNESIHNLRAKLIETNDDLDFQVERLKELTRRGNEEATRYLAVNQGERFKDQAAESDAAWNLLASKAHMEYNLFTPKALVESLKTMQKARQEFSEAKEGFGPEPALVREFFDPDSLKHAYFNFAKEDYQSALDSARAYLTKTKDQIEENSENRKHAYWLEIASLHEMRMKVGPNVRRDIETEFDTTPAVLTNLLPAA